MRPRSRLENQPVIATTPPGAPKLWNQPLSPHSSTASHSVVANPIARLHSAVIKKANARKRLMRSEEHTSELQSLMRISYAVFCLKKKKTTTHDYYKDNEIPYT